MANNASFRIKRSSVPGKIPTVDDLDFGELAVNTYDGKMYMKIDDGTVSIIEVNTQGVATTVKTVVNIDDEEVSVFDTRRLTDNDSNTIAILDEPIQNNIVLPDTTLGQLTPGFNIRFKNDNGGKIQLSVEGNKATINGKPNYILDNPEQFTDLTLVENNKYVIDQSGHTTSLGFTIRTTTNNEVFNLPFVNGYNYDAQIRWGDGKSSRVISWDDQYKTHTYEQPGDYTIYIDGTCERLDLGLSPDRLKIVKLNDWGDTGLTHSENMLNGCSNCEFSESSFTNTTNLTSLNGMLANCSIGDPNVEGFDVSNITQANNFLTGTPISTENYDKLLESWSKQSLQPGVVLDVPQAKYTNVEARDNIIAQGWTINDNGLKKVLNMDGNESQVLSLNDTKTDGYGWASIIELMYSDKDGGIDFGTFSQKGSIYIDGGNFVI